MNQSVERAARLLGLFTLTEPDLTLGELAEKLATSKPSAYRYATALRRAGLLRVNGDRYSLGPRIVQLAAVALAGLDVVPMAQRFLVRLARESNETALLSVWDGEAPVIVAVEDSNDQLVRITVRAGSRLPPESAQGRIFRSHLAADGDVSLRTVRRDGYAYDDQVVEGIAVIAVPILQAGRIVATLAVAGMHQRIPAKLEGQVGTSLRSIADALSLELGSEADWR